MALAPRLALVGVDDDSLSDHPGAAQTRLLLLCAVLCAAWALYVFASFIIVQAQSKNWLVTLGARKSPVALRAVKYAKACTPVHQVPKDLMYIIARFLDLDVASLVRADSALWRTFSNDCLLWTGAVAAAQTTAMGRSLLLRHAPSVIARCPALRVLVPQPLACDVQRFATSPDGAQVACSSRCAFIVLEGATGHVLASVKVGALVRDLCYSWSGAYLACIGQARIWLYETATWTCVRRHAEHGGCPWMTPVCALPDDDFVSGTQRCGLALWGASCNTVGAASVESRSFVWSLAASRTAFASGHRDGLLQMWSLKGKRLRAFNGLTADVTCMQFSGDGARLVAASRAGAVCVWDASTGERVCFARAGDGDPIVSLSLSSTGLLAMALGESNKVEFARVGVECAIHQTTTVDHPTRVRFAPTAAAAVGAVAATDSEEVCYVASLNGWLATLSPLRTACEPRPPG